MCLMLLFLVADDFFQLALGPIVRMNCPRDRPKASGAALNTEELAKVFHPIGFSCHTIRGEIRVTSPRKLHYCNVS